MAHFTYQRATSLELNAAEVLRELDKLPHLLLRIAIRGARFPQRALPHFARVLATEDDAHTTEPHRPIEAHLVEIDADEGGLRAYFPADLPLRGRLQVGYGSEVHAEIPLSRLEMTVHALDPHKIQGAFHRVTQDDPGMFKLIGIGGRG